MAITIQLTEVPENETVVSRVFSLSEQQVSFGASFEAQFQLPDRSGVVAPIHGHFKSINNIMYVQAEQSIVLNDTLLAPGRKARLYDGTCLVVGGYTLLVSDSERFYSSELNESTPSDDTAPKFTLPDDDFEMIEPKIVTSNVPLDDEKNVPFAQNGVLMDDPFSIDPFEEEEISLSAESAMKRDFAVQKDSFDIELETIKAIPKNESAEPIKPHNMVIDSAQSQAYQAPNLERLVALLEQQIQDKNDQNKRLFNVLDKVLDTFLEEFSPAHLEDVFSDFSGSIFSNKEKQYWRMYRNNFQRKADKGEFHRLFKAILMEHLQGEGGE